MGAAVPFTSPELTGARARISARGLELTLPNPAGKRGIYIVDPREIKALCTPTLHDARLVALLAEQPSITPAVISRVARAVAEAGYAGRAAAAAARQRQLEERLTWGNAQSGILRGLVAHAADALHNAPTLDQAAQAALAALSTRSGQSTSALIEAIDAAAHLAAAAGPAGSAEARYPGLLAELAELGRSVSQQAPVAARADLGRAGQAASLLLSAARDTIILGRRALADARQSLADLQVQLSEVTRLRATLRQHAERLDWLLDGWAPICLVWRMASPGRHCAALNEVGLMVPTIPVEAGAWFGANIQEAPRQSLRAAVVGFADWRSFGLVHDLLVRNEAIRALCP